MYTVIVARLLKITVTHRNSVLLQFEKLFVSHSVKIQQRCRQLLYYTVGLWDGYHNVKEKVTVMLPMFAPLPTKILRALMASAVFSGSPRRAGNV